MTMKTEGKHRAAFLVSYEDDGFYCFEKGTVAASQTLVAGQAVKVSGGNLVAWAGSGTIVGLMMEAVTTASGETYDTVYLARGPAEVRATDLYYNDGSNDAAQKSGLLALSPPIVQR
ncbi:MAG: head decoration protein [Alsobacter sp.]